MMLGKSKKITEFWKNPLTWVLGWLVYALTALAYFAYQSAQSGFIFCTGFAA